MPSTAKENSTTNKITANVMIHLLVDHRVE